MGRLDDKTVIITGGARGQGAAEATLFRTEGANVIITDVLNDPGAEVAARIGATFLHHDVRSEQHWADVIGATVAQHDRIDVLVNNAGVLHAGTILDTDLAAYQRTIDVNQIGVFLGLRAIAPTMISQHAGSIINTSSVAGLRGYAVGFAYVASKFAVTGMTKSAALTLAPYNIRVNSIHPGLINTDMMTELTGGNTQLRDTLIDRLPTKRLADPHEVATIALFLASDDSSYCTGSEFIVDGGMTL